MFVIVYVYFYFFKSLPGLEQYAVKKFAESLESIPRALAENTGMKVRINIKFAWANCCYYKVFIDCITF